MYLKKSKIVLENLLWLRTGLKHKRENELYGDQVECFTD